MLEASYRLPNVSTHSLSSIVSLFEHLIKFLTCIYGQVKKKKKAHFDGKIRVRGARCRLRRTRADYEGHEQAVSDGVQPIQVSRLTHGSGHCSLSGKLSRISVFEW